MTDLSRMYFHALPKAEQEAAIRRLAAAGHGEHTIAHATGISVEQIRRVLIEEGRREVSQRIAEAEREARKLREVPTREGNPYRKWK